MKEYIDVLNTGFGVSIFITIPYKDRVVTILLDSGDNNPTIYKDSRRIKITEYLKTRNIKHIDFAILSHIHRDHIAGYNEILDQDITFGKFISNMPTHSLSKALLEIEQQYQDIPTQYILYSLKEYKKIIDRLENKTEIVVLNNTLDICLESYTLTIVPIEQQLLQGIYTNLKLADNINLPIEERYQYIRKFDSQLNNTTLSLILKKEGKAIFYSPGERDLSKFENCCLKESVEILHSPHHGDANFLGKQALLTLKPKFIIVCADSVGTYNLPTKNLLSTIQQFSSADICFTETTKSEYQIIRFVINNTDIEINYILLNNIQD